MQQIDCTGLGPEEVKLVKEFLEFLKARASRQPVREEDIEYRQWPLGVKGEVTRKEIYDNL